MDIKAFKNKITVEQILSLMQELGAEARNTSNENEIAFNTICHGGKSHKLYFYKDSKEFFCYSSCGHLDIINIIEKTKNLSNKQAIQYLCEKFNIRINDYSQTFITSYVEELLELKSLRKLKPKKEERIFNLLDENILNRFYEYYHPAFYEDGIEIKTLKKFGIRYDILNKRIIIPHRNEDGKLIAIRCRNLDEDLIKEGKKYMPITYNNKLLSAKTTYYLFGLNLNKENIKKAKKIIIVESEKAVMQLDTILEDNISVALSSSNLSDIQIDLIKSLGVEEVIIALDKEFETIGSIKEQTYALKIRKSFVEKLKGFFDVSIIWDNQNLLNEKDAPSDKGKDVFLKLYKHRIKV